MMASMTRATTRSIFQFSGLLRAVNRAEDERSGWRGQVGGVGGPPESAIDDFCEQTIEISEPMAEKEHRYLPMMGHHGRRSKTTTDAPNPVMDGNDD